MESIPCFVRLAFIMPTNVFDWNLYFRRPWIWR